MISKTKLVTMVVSSASVLAMAMITHYVLTQVPEPLDSSMDISVYPTDINAYDAITGLTPLMQAAIDGDVERAKILLEKGAKVNLRSANKDFDTALGIALLNGGKLGNLAVAYLLIENGADVDMANARGMAPLHLIEGGITNFDNRVQMHKALMDRGAHINAQAEDGSTPLIIAVTNFEDIRWIDYVIKKYGQIINYDIRNKNGETAMDLAIKRGVVSENNADSVQNSLSKRPVYIGDNLDVKATDTEGRNGLQLAVIRDDMPFVTALTEHGADLAYQDKKGNTALHYAVDNLDPVTYVKYLLEKKAPTTLTNKNGETPLMWVMRIRSQPKRYEVAKLLIEAGSPISVRNGAGKTILDLAQVVHDQQLISLINGALARQLKRR